jgi:hypothetical protein
VTASTIAKRTFTIIGCAAGCALLTAAITLPLLPLWPALAIITGVALLALAITTVVIFCTKAFEETQIAETPQEAYQRLVDDVETECKTRARCILTYFPSLLRNGEGMEECLDRLRADYGNIDDLTDTNGSFFTLQTYSEDPQEFERALLDQLWAKYKEVLLQRSPEAALTDEQLEEAAATHPSMPSLSRLQADTNRLAVLGQLCLQIQDADDPETARRLLEQMKQLEIKNVADVEYDRHVADAKAAHQEKVEQILHYFPQLKKSDETLEDYLRNSSNNYCDDWQTTMYPRQTFKDQHSLGIIQGILEKNPTYLSSLLSRPLWIAYERSTLDRLVELNVLLDPSAGLAAASLTPIGTQPIPQAIQLVQAQLNDPNWRQNIQTPSSSSSRTTTATKPSTNKSESVYHRIAENLKTSYREYVARTLALFPQLAQENESTDAYVLRSANDYQLLDQSRENDLVIIGKKLARQQTVEQIEETYSGVRLSQLWNSYTALASSDFASLYPGQQWPTLEFLSTQDPA